MIDDKIEKNFTYQNVDEGAVIEMDCVRATAKEFAYYLDTVCPDSREKSLAMTKLEEAVFWANAALARYNVKEYNNGHSKNS